MTSFITQFWESSVLLLDCICLIVKKVLLLIAGYQAFRYQDFRIGFIDRIVYNHLGTKSK